jgi:DNA-directed RNA polymerase specialized sigma24 family protein
MTDRVTSRWYKTGNGISAADLLRACGQKLTDHELWQKFHDRFQNPIFLYVLRTLRQQQNSEDVNIVAADIAQDVYMRMVQNDGRMLCSFRGNTDRSVLAFLARVAMNVVTDYHRREQAEKRQPGQVISIDEARDIEGSSGNVSQLNVTALLSWIDVQKLIDADSDRKNSARNVLILKLHLIEGFSAEELAEYPGFSLTASGIKMVIQRLTARLQQGI